MPTNIGTANYAAQYGIPDATLSWVGRTGTQTITANIFTSFETAAGGDTTFTRDNENEVRAIRTTNETLQHTVAVKPLGSTEAAALLKSGDLPQKGRILTIAAGGDLQLNATGTNVIDEARVSYTPDNEAIINLTFTNYLGKTLTALS